MQSSVKGRTVAHLSYLPRELFRRDSDLDRLITIAGDSAADGTFGAANTVTVTRGMLRRLCPDYRPGRAIDLDVLCGSGEADGRALRLECRTCLVSQFAPSGTFCGDLVPDDEASQAKLLPMHSGDPLTIELTAFVS
jgi:hypothetical protein